MPVGDLVGDLATAYLTPAQRQAQLLKGAVKQTSFDATNTATGPVARAQQQLPPVSLASLAPGGAVAAQPPAAPSLASLGAGYSTQPAANPSTAVKPQASGLGSLAPVGAPPTTDSPSYPGASQQSASLGSLSPVAAQTPVAAATPAGLEAAYRPVGNRQGTNAIVGRLGADGAPEFSNRTTDLASAAGMAPVSNPPQQSGDLASLASLAPGAASSPEFAALGSARNLGDGVGTFSQSNAGDAALSLARFGRANDIRRAGQDQDRLDLANARNAQAGQLTVVRDSSKPLTKSDIAQAQLDQQGRQSLADAATGAQGIINDRRQGAAADQQLRQATRLEDLANAASGPNATPQAKAAYLAATDPTGDKALARQQAQAQLSNTQKEGQIKQQQYEQSAVKQTQDQQTLATQKTGSLDIAKRARDLAQTIGSNGQFDKITGTVDSITPTFFGGSQDLINQASQLQTLLTADNLKLMTGVLTDKDIAFLTQIGSGLNVGKNGINGSEEGARKVLGEITGRLNQKITEYEKTNPAQPASSQPASTSQAAQPSVPTITSKAQADALPAGSLFIGPDGKQYRK
jgi:hypothetical protein